MKYLKIHIEAESGDDIGKFLKDIAGPLSEVKYSLGYKDSIVEEMVRAFVAEQLSDDKFFADKDDNKL